MFKKGDHLKKSKSAMAGVYAGPDSLYWKTRRMEDVNMLDPDAAKMREAFNKTKETQSNDASNENAPDMQKSEKKRFCPACGSLVSLSDHFCRECGAKLTYPDTDKQV